MDFERGPRELLSLTAQRKLVAPLDNRRLGHWCEAERPAGLGKFPDLARHLGLQLRGGAERVAKHACPVVLDLRDERSLVGIQFDVRLAVDHARHSCRRGSHPFIVGGGLSGVFEDMAVMRPDEQHVDIGALDSRQARFPARHCLRGEVLKPDRRMADRGDQPRQGVALLFKPTPDAADEHSHSDPPFTTACRAAETNSSQRSRLAWSSNMVSMPTLTEDRPKPISISSGVKSS